MSFNIITEDGDNIITEDGDNIVTEDYLSSTQLNPVTLTLVTLIRINQELVALE